MRIIYRTEESRNIFLIAIDEQRNTSLSVQRSIGRAIRRGVFLRLEFLGLVLRMKIDSKGNLKFGTAGVLRSPGGN